MKRLASNKTSNSSITMRPEEEQEKSRSNLRFSGLEIHAVEEVGKARVRISELTIRSVLAL
jgi:hypothetical protein